MIDLLGEIKRIMNIGAAETFDPATDSLEAIAAALGVGPGVGLWMFGIVDATQVASTITVITNNLQNVPNDTLEGQFWMQVIYNTSAPATAPEGEIRHITNFVQGGALQTFTVDAFTANVEAGDLVIIFHESLLSHEILGSGTLDTSSATVPADSTRTEGNNYFRGHLLMTTEGAQRFRPTRIVEYTGVGGIFTLDPNNPFTAVPGLVDYVILGDQTEFIPGVDGANNRTPSDVIGNKQDTALQAPTAADSLTRYIKGLLIALGNPTGDTLATFAAKWGDIARSLDLILGARWDAAGDLGTDIASLDADVDPRVMGRLQIEETTIDLDQAAASYPLFTGTTQDVVVEKLVITMPNIVAGGALTSISIQTDDVTPQVLIDNVLGAVANLTAEAQLAYVGAISVHVGAQIELTIAGGAHGVAYVCDVEVQYRAVVSDGYLA